LLVLAAAGCGQQPEESSGAWFTFTRHATPEAYVQVTRAGAYEAVTFRQPAASAHGMLDDSQLDVLEEVLSPEKLTGYLRTGQGDGGTCHQAGYVLTSGQGVGCWLPDNVQDPETQVMLTRLIQLLERAAP
jgi:hypothetical protein